MHLGAMLTHLEYTISDHRPLLLDSEHQPTQTNNNSSPHRFEAKWLQDKNFKELVEKAWEDADLVAGSDRVLAKLGHMHTMLHDWDKKFLKLPKKRIKKAQREFEKAMNGPMTDENDAKAKELANLVEILLEQEEIHWLQHSRVNWLSQGDKNTRFFHQFASARRNKNMIKRLKDDSKEWVEGT
jgi:hypothetical protein